MERRKFIKNSGAFCLLGSFNSMIGSCIISRANKINITSVASAVEKEPLLKPFGFKGGYLSELWQTVAQIKSANGNQAVGLGTQSVLWSDSTVFAGNSENTGNEMMYAITKKALELIRGRDFHEPVSVLEDIADELYKYGQHVTKNPHLRKTFILNALVPVDNALWMLYAKENGIHSFDEMIPPKFRHGIQQKHNKIAAIPLISYDTTPAQLQEIIDRGYFFMKIKIGQQGTQEEMLQKDMERLTALHNVLKKVHTPHTTTGKLPYYFDANGRYESKNVFLRFLDHARKIDAFDQIVLIEEPFPEDLEMDVADIPVRLAADETAHTDVDVLKRIQMGYRAIALKPIAKTLSMSLKIAALAEEHHVPCFCADLTVNPVLVEWNKNIAARLSSFPGLENLGLLESNGHQNYKNWEDMKNYVPGERQPWMDVHEGFYQTGNKFFSTAACIFENPPHYQDLIV